MPRQKKIESVGLVCKPRDSKIWTQVKKVNTHLNKLGIKTYILGSFKNRENLISCDSFMIGKKCDLIVSLGGDGTLLFAAREFSKFAIPIIGINYGLIGHLNEIEPQNDLTNLNEILSGNYTSSFHTLIKHNIKPALGARVGQLAVNDIVIRGARGISMIEVKISTASKIMNFRADGVIIATPIGSSSYSQSAGGPVLDKELSAILITPICPHLERVSSYVCSNDERIKIEVKSTKSMQSEIYCDGQFCVSMKNPTTIHINKSNQKLELIHLLKDEYLS